MLNTELYLENTLIELDESVHFAITKQFEDITNPAVIISDWSKSVAIPGTPRNNAFFGHIYHPDMQILNSSVAFTGLNFDPTRKLDMRLMYNGSLLMRGYAKVIDIKQVNGKITYDVTLSGQMGRLFKELSKIRFDSVTDTSVLQDAEYVIDTSVFFTEVMDVSHMSNMFSRGQVITNVYDTSNNLNPALRSTDIIGFAPNDAKSPDFDYSTFQVNKNTATLFTDSLTTHRPALVYQIPADTIYPDGLMPREIGEYRTYNQLPFIYVNKLFQIVGKKCYDLTGYRFIFDYQWFVKNNPYWYDYIMMLQPIVYHNEQLKDQTKSNSYPSFVSSAVLSGSSFSGISDSSCYAQKMSGNYREDIPIANWDGNNRSYYFNSTVEQGIVNVPFSIYVSNFDSQKKRRIRFYQDAGLVIEMRHFDASNNLIDSISAIAVDAETTINTANYDGVAYFAEWPFYNSGHRIDFNLTDVFRETQTRFTGSFRTEMRCYWVQGSHSSPLVDDDDDPYTSTYPINVTASGAMSVRFAKEIRSGSSYHLSDLWNFEASPWQCLLNYCKLMRIIIQVDESKHAITFMRQVDYFNRGLTLEDWTDKLNMHRDFIVKPVYWGSQNVLLNYDDSETQVGQTYQDKYGVNYGDKKIVTDYTFDSNTATLFSGLKPAIITTNNVLSWTDVWDNGQVVYTRPSREISLYVRDNDGKMKNPFGQFAFCTGSALWENDSRSLRPVCLSDDTALQMSQNKYYYTQGADPQCYALVNSYMRVDVAKNRSLSLIGTPHENYSTSSWNGRSDIYDCFWRKFINERYNIQSKMITCYFDIQPLDYLKFRWNKFLKVGNQVYFVNKIYDYDCLSQESTKVDLISVRDITAYTSDNYQYIDGRVVGGRSTFIAGETGQVWIDSNNDGSWVIESPGIFGWTDPMSGTGSGARTFTISQDAEPGDYTMTVIRSDSPFTSLSEKEHVRITITVTEPNP